MSVRVEVRAVHHRYGADGPTALRDLTVDIPAGCLATVLGPSGSGKSTLLSLIAGTTAPCSGDILFDGGTVLMTPAPQRGVALVLQRPYLFPYLTVAENVAFGLAARGMRRKARLDAAGRWLARVGLDGMGARRPEQLSGGEQQRVALVRALATQPRVLLLDEPLASLDPDVRESLQSMLRSIVGETRVTTLLVTHDLAEAMSLGDRTVLLRDGRLVGEGPSQELFQRPPTRDAARFVGVSTFVEGTAGPGVLTTRAGALAVDGLAGSGRRTTVAIRPENVRLVERHGVNTIPGRAVQSTFRGEHWDVVVDTALGALRARADRPARESAPCLVALPTSALFVLEEHASAPGADGDPPA